MSHINRLIVFSIVTVSLSVFAVGHLPDEQEEIGTKDQRAVDSTGKVVGRDFLDEVEEFIAVNRNELQSFKRPAKAAPFTELFLSKARVRLQKEQTEKMLTRANVSIGVLEELISDYHQKGITNFLAEETKAKLKELAEKKSSAREELDKLKRDYDQFRQSAFINSDNEVLREQVGQIVNSYVEKIQKAEFTLHQREEALSSFHESNVAERVRDMERTVVRLSAAVGTLQEQLNGKKGPNPSEGWNDHSNAIEQVLQERINDEIKNAIGPTNSSSSNVSRIQNVR